MSLSSFAYNRAEFNYKMRESRSNTDQNVNVREIHKPSWCAIISRGEDFGLPPSETTYHKYIHGRLISHSKNHTKALSNEKKKRETPIMIKLHTKLDR
jgi:hypothetical protein